MSEFDSRLKSPFFDQDDDDDIEMLEVVGLDESDRPAPATPPEEEAEPRAQPEESREALDDSAAVPGEESVSLDRFRRLQADFSNFKKRVERDRADEIRHAAGKLVEQLLPVLDNFERAVSTPPDPDGKEDNLRQGVVLIFRQLLKELRREGLRPVDSVGEKFDPKVHDAVATTTSGDLPSQTIVEELQRGYLLHERLLRPALVRVCIDVDGESPELQDDEEDSEIDG
ncbi:MAG: nucleotide exchange factor GrpE [bacterium]|nr:nucleotide exchange factor GrpE [bacterium]